MKTRRPALAMPGPEPAAPAVHAPGSSPEGLLFPGPDLPRVSDRLVVPEITRDEVVRGRRVKASPANPEHGDPHCRTDYIITAHVAPGYVASTDMLTRFTEESDFATDTSIRRIGTDPSTGERYLEEVAFEVVNGQKLTGPKGISNKAPEMIARGVRRVFAVFVRRGQVAEWKDTWVPFERDGEIADPVFARPVPIRALLVAAEADNAVAQALIDKKNPVILQVEKARLLEGRREGRQEGRQEGRREGQQEGELRARREVVIELLEARGLRLSAELVAQIRAVQDPWILKQLLIRAAVATGEDDLFSADH